MSILTFDRERLADELRGLPRALRVVFAAACAERLMPAYRRLIEQEVASTSNILTEAMEVIWARPNDGGGLDQQRIDECLALVPDDSDIEPWTEQTSHAQDAGIAALHAVKAWMTGDADEAAWAASLVYDSLDLLVINKHNLDMNAPGAERVVASDPIVQAELHRQRRDLAELKTVNSSDAIGVASRFRARAISEPAL